MNVQRGADGTGSGGQRCTNCHGAANNRLTNAPGAPQWRLAPQSMGWEGLSVPELCRTLLDRAGNGNRSPKDLLNHVTEDPIVRWGWDPGGKRDPVPIPHAEFVRLFAYWVETGAKCPS